MKKLVSVGLLVLLLFSYNVFHNNDAAYAIGDGCSNNHKFDEQTIVRLENDLSQGINYYRWTIEYKNKFGQDMIKKGNDRYARIDGDYYYIKANTEFHLKFYDEYNQIIAERKIIVEPIETVINLYEVGYLKLSGKTIPNANIQIQSMGSDTGLKEFETSSNSDGIFKFDYDANFSTSFYLEKKEHGVTRIQSISIEKKFIDGNPPTIDHVSGTDNDTAIMVSTKDLLKGLNLEFYDKNKKLIETNISFGSKKDTSKTFFMDGIKYVRYQAININDCRSAWAEMELVDAAPPKFELNPWIEGDDYLIGISDPGSRVEWRQNPFSKNEIKGSLFVPKSGVLKIKFPLDIKTNPSLIEFYDEIGNSASEWVQPVSKIDRFAVTEDREQSIFALSDTSASSYYGKNYSIEFNGKRWSGSIGNGGVMQLDGGDINFILPKLPYELNFTLYNGDGSVKYSVRQMVTKKEKPSQLKNISYDLDKQELYADSNLYYTASLWNKNTDWQSFVYAKSKRIKLSLSDKKKIVKVGDKVTLNTSIPGAPSLPQEIIIKQNKKLKTPAVKDVTTKSRYIEGTTYPNSKVLVKSGKKNYQGQSDSKGKYKIKIPSLSAGSEVAVSAVDRLNQLTPVVKVKVLRVFTNFTISKIKSGGTALKGAGYIGSEVKAYKSSKLIAKGTVDKKGNYTLKVSKLKKNDTLLLKMSKSGFQTMTKTIRVN